jgi:hypothetical protein
LKLVVRPTRGSFTWSACPIRSTDSIAGERALPSARVLVLPRRDPESDEKELRGHDRA